MNICSTRQPRPLLHRPVPEFQDPRARMQESAGAVIDDAATFVGTAFWGATGTGLGALAGVAASIPAPEYSGALIGLGAVGGGIAAAAAYSRGHGDMMGTSIMAVAALGFSTGLGYLLGGSTGAVIGGALGAAYAGAGIYVALDC